MYFNLNGKIDVSQMLSSTDSGIDSKKFCTQIIENGIRINEFYCNAQIEKWKNYYYDMHPKTRLCEDIVKKDIANDDIKGIFAKFFKPLDAENCSVSIVDPYLFSSGTNVELLSDILISNVKSKNIKFITDFSKDDFSVREYVMQKIEQAGFKPQSFNRNDSHDRYWFTRKNGFAIGTSFNGLGNKISTFTMLSSKDLNDVISIFGI